MIQPFFCEISLPVLFLYVVPYPLTSDAATFSKRIFLLRAGKWNHAFRFTSLLTKQAVLAEYDDPPYSQSHTDGLNHFSPWLVFFSRDFSQRADLLFFLRSFSPPRPEGDTALQKGYVLGSLSGCLTTWTTTLWAYKKHLTYTLLCRSSSS